MGGGACYYGMPLLGGPVSHTADIIKHYRDKGLHGKALRLAVDRHARLLERHDGQVAFCLRAARLLGERRFAEQKGTP